MYELQEKESSGGISVSDSIGIFNPEIAEEAE